jgi:hypothetical protein
MTNATVHASSPPGITGFLRVFAILVGVVIPLIHFLGAQEIESHGKQALPTAEAPNTLEQAIQLTKLMTHTKIACWVAAAYLLFRGGRVRRTIYVVIALLWASPAITFAGYVYAATALAMPNSFGVFLTGIFDTIASAIWALLGTAYLALSRNVRAVFLKPGIGDAMHWGEPTLDAPRSGSAQAPGGTGTLEDLYAEALSEFGDESRRRRGLWAQCLAENDGETSRAQAAYLRARVAEMMSTKR